MDDREQKIRERAFRIWLDEGMPEGRAEAHWDLARELVAIEESQAETTIKIAAAESGEPVEPVLALENTGEFPTTTDQGEMQTPHRGA